MTLRIVLLLGLALVADAFNIMPLMRGAMQAPISQSALSAPPDVLYFVMQEEPVLDAAPVGDPEVLFDSPLNPVTGNSLSKSLSIFAVLAAVLLFGRELPGLVG